MGPLTKEPPESAKTTRDPASHGDLAPQGMPTASFDAFGIEIPVQLQGGRAGASAHSAPDTYHEDTCTLIVFPQGAVLRSSTNLATGQHLMLKNQQTSQEVPCRVVNLRSYCAGYVEIEFIRPIPGFWGISFPSEAAKPSPASVPAAPSTAVTALPKIVEQPVVTAAIVPAASPIGKASIPFHKTPPNKEMPGAITPSKPSVPPSVAIVPAAGFPAVKEHPTRPASTSPALLMPAPFTPASSSFPAAAPPRQQESLPIADLVDIRAAVESATAAALLTSGNTSAGATALADSIGSFDENERWGTLSYGKSSTAQIPGTEERKGDELGLGVTLPASEHKRRGKLVPALATAAALVLALGTGASLLRRHSLNTAAVAASPVMTQAPEQPKPVAQPQTVTNPGVETLQAPVQVPVGAPAQAPARAPVQAPVGPPSIHPSSQPGKQAPPAITEGIAAQPKQAKASAAAPPAPAPKPSFKLAPSTSAPKRAAVSRETPQLPALAEEVGSSPNGQANFSNGITADALRSGAEVPPPPQPAKIPENVGGDVRLPRLLHMVPPSYPPSAKQNNVQGEVTVQASIDAAGKVTDAKAVSGPPLLQQAAINAVRRWKYEPATLNGKPVPMQVVVKLKFHLN